MTIAEVLKEEGIQKGKAEIAIKLVNRRFGIIPELMKEEISRLDIKKLEAIIDGIFDFKTLEDVQKVYKKKD